MFGIDFCDAKLNPDIISSFSQMYSFLVSLGLSSSSSFDHEILALACLLLKQTFAA